MFRSLSWVLVVRVLFYRGPASLPWLSVVSDTRLSLALHSICEQPALAYTVDSLAVMPGMSRSAFASAFRRAFGQSPMSLVKLVWLRRAGELLITTAIPVAEVTRRVGFSSRRTFSLAFNEIHGQYGRASWRS